MFLLPSWVKYVVTDAYVMAVSTALLILYARMYRGVGACGWSNVENVNLLRLGTRSVLCVLPV